MSFGEFSSSSMTVHLSVACAIALLTLFSILSVLLIGLNVPYNYPNLNSKETRTSPFTIVFQMTGAKAAGSVINAVILTSVLSAGNHALFAGTRLLYTLAMEGHAPRFFGKLNRHQVPWVAVLTTGFVAGLCFGSSFIGAGQLWSWLQKYVMLPNHFDDVSLTGSSVVLSVFLISSAGSPSVSLPSASAPPSPAKARHICFPSRTGLTHTAPGLPLCSTHSSF
jgi:AAT family amino acid transporter